MKSADRKQLVGLRTRDGSIVLEEGAQVAARPGQKPPMELLGHVTSSYASSVLGYSIALAAVAGRQGPHRPDPLRAHAARRRGRRSHIADFLRRRGSTHQWLNRRRARSPAVSGLESLPGDPPTQGTVDIHLLPPASRHIFHGDAAARAAANPVWGRRPARGTPAARWCRANVPPFGSAPTSICCWAPLTSPTAQASRRSNTHSRGFLMPSRTSVTGRLHCS